MSFVALKKYTFGILGLALGPRPEWNRNEVITITLYRHKDTKRKKKKNKRIGHRVSTV